MCMGSVLLVISFADSYCSYFSYQKNPSGKPPLCSEVVSLMGWLVEDKPRGTMFPVPVWRDAERGHGGSGGGTLPDHRGSGWRCLACRKERKWKCNYFFIVDWTDKISDFIETIFSNFIKNSKKITDLVPVSWLCNVHTVHTMYTKHRDVVKSLKAARVKKVTESLKTEFWSKTLGKLDSNWSKTAEV